MFNPMLAQARILRSPKSGAFSSIGSDGTEANAKQKSKLKFEQRRQFLSIAIIQWYRHKNRWSYLNAPD